MKHIGTILLQTYSAVHGACKERVTEKLGCELAHGCSVEKVVVGFCVPG